MEERIIREEERRRITGVPRTTWHRLRTKGLTPEPVKVVGEDSPAIGYRLSDLQDWIQSRKTAKPKK